MGRRNSHIRRRRAVAVAALAAVVLAGAVLFAQAFGADRHGAQEVDLSIHSRFVPATLPVVAVVPPGPAAGPRPLLVFLHGRGDDQGSNLVSGMFAALTALGPRAPDVVFPDGGDHSYWHDRRGGRWAEYVLDEVIPQALARLHADPRRIAIGGISMGGFGALDLARLHPGRFCAVGAHSPALWLRGADTAPGAFDDATDFERHDVIAAARTGRPYGATPVWIDAGDEDPFLAADRAMAAALRTDGTRLSFHVWPGAHSHDYWDANWSRYLGFYARALAACR